MMLASDSVSDSVHDRPGQKGLIPNARLDARESCSKLVKGCLPDLDPVLCAESTHRMLSSTESNVVVQHQTSEVAGSDQ